MRKLNWLICLLVYTPVLQAQSVSEKLRNAIQQFEVDSQMRHATYSLYVIDAKTGKVVFDRNSEIGLAPASTQKLITSGAAFELLGNDYRYKTLLGYDGKIEKGTLNGNLFVIGSGDPTLGSWRWPETKESTIFHQWSSAVRKSGIKHITGVITTNESRFSHQAIPDGWIWQDIGNYYGAGAYQLNWKENQYEIVLKSGNKVNDSVAVVDTTVIADYVNELKSAAKGTGDNAYVYLSVARDRNVLLKGTIPVGEKSFSISGASPDPVTGILLDFTFFLMSDSINSLTPCFPGRDMYDRDPADLAKLKYFYTHYSPPLDSMNFWFLRRSINLYGEAFVKTVAYERSGLGSTEKGVELVKDFWSKQGIDKTAINIVDGSGLSPLNRITTSSLVQVLQFAKTRSWYHSFYEALPTYNGMKMKSGSISGARSFAGYHTSANGQQYIFAIIVNNYSGSSSAIVNKMYKVLDALK